MTVYVYSPTFNTSNTSIKYRIELAYEPYNIVGNYTPVNVKVQAWRTTDFDTYGTGTCYCTINGVGYSQAITSSQHITLNSYTTLFSLGLNIPHNADGTKTLDMASYISHERFSSSNQGWSYALPTIPRASSITAFSNFTLGFSDINLAVSTLSYSSTFNLDFTLKVGANVIETWNDIPANGGNQNHVLELSAGLQDTILALMSTVESTTVTITCQTQSGGTNIGSLQSLNATATVSSAIIPTITGFSHSDTVSAVSAQVGLYVKLLSNLHITVTGASAPAHCTISGYRITYKGTTYTTQSIDTGIIQDVSIPISVWAIDSRGRASAVYSSTLTALDYSLPAVPVFTAKRCTVAGVLDDLGDYMSIAINGTVSSLVNSTQRNTASFVVSSRVKGTGSFVDKITQSGTVPNTVFGSGSSPLSGYPITTAYEFKIVFSDFFNSTTTIVDVATGKVLMSWTETRVGIGKVPTQGVLDVLGDAYIEGDSYVNGIRLNSANTGLTGDNSIAFWQSVKQGIYWIGSAVITGQPSTYGMLDVKRSGTEGVALWYQQGADKVWRKWFNSGVQSGWVEVITGEYSQSGNRWGVLPIVQQADGLMEIGKYIDFHETEGDTGDYSTRFESTGRYQYLTSVNGTGLMVTRIKQIHVQRTANAGAGTQVITVPFYSKYVRCTTFLSGTANKWYHSDGVYDEVGNQMAMMEYGDGTNGQTYQYNTFVAMHSGGAYNFAAITGITNTSITLTWSQVGTIGAGTINMLFECYGQ